MKNKCIAMILAGGNGSRLLPLTKKLAKPAVLFAGKYRIIDFTLSNCINSNITTIGILVQYEPLSINTCINSKGAWNLEKGMGSITILPPHMRENGGSWYKGTANAVYQNLEYIKFYNPDYILILSADQVYKMDYSHLLDFHIQSKADVTITATKVPSAEANRFGILREDSSHRIYEFEEKPAFPKGDLASMGIYVFNRETLLKALEYDEADSCSNNDFGKNIIPNLVNNTTTKVYAYKFEGYWRDVGTLKSFWEAHMDLLDENSNLNLQDPSWKIYCDTSSQPPIYINHTAKVNASIIGDGCYIQGIVDNSILFPGVFIGRNASVFDSVVMSNAVIESDSMVTRAIIGSHATIKTNSRVGAYSDLSNNITYIDEGQVVQNRLIMSNV